MESTNNEQSNNVNMGQISSNDGFTKVIRGKYNYKNVTPNITLEQFKALISKDKIVFYDKHGKSSEFVNEGIFGRHYDTVKDKDKMKYKFTVSMRTYLNLTGDIVVMEWLDGEVKYTTKLNHCDLKNWSSKMYWNELPKAKVQEQAQAQAQEQAQEQEQVQAQEQAQEQEQEQA